MAALPDNLTARQYYDYQQGAFQHTLMVRCTDSESVAQVDTQMDAIWTAVAAQLVQTTIIGVRRSPEGSNNSFPVSSTVAGKTYGIGTSTTLNCAQFITFVGRSVGGRRARMTFFGYDGTVPADFRLTVADLGMIGVVSGLLNAQAFMFLAADALRPTWYSYANFGYNAYWQRNNRS